MEQSRAEQSRVEYVYNVYRLNDGVHLPHACHVLDCCAWLTSIIYLDQLLLQVSSMTIICILLRSDWLSSSSFATFTTFCSVLRYRPVFVDAKSIYSAAVFVNMSLHCITFTTLTMNIILYICVPVHANAWSHMKPSHTSRGG